MASKIAALTLAAVVALGAQAPDVSGLVRRADDLKRSDYASGRREAETLYRQALPLVGTDGRLAARIALELGALAAWRGDLAASQTWFGQAIAGYEAVADRPGYAAALNQMGSILLTLGRINEARGMYARSREIWIEQSNPRGQAQTHANDALAWRASGDLQRALDSNRRAVELSREAGHQAGEATALHNNSEVLIDLGDFDEALRVAEDALQLHRVAGPISGEIHTLIHLAEAWIGKQDFARARESLDLAAARAREIGEPVQEAYILRETGRIGVAMGQTAAALASFQAALRRVPAEGFPLMEAEIQLRVGQAAFVLGRRDAAGAAWTRALSLASEIGNPLLQAEALVGLARLDRDQGRLAAALERAARATTQIESSRAALANAAQRASYLSVRSAAFGLEADLLVRQGQIDRAFDASERAHARALLDVLTSPSAVAGRAADARPLSIAAIRATLDDRTAVLEYLVGVDSSLVFVLTRESIQAFRLRDQAALTATIDAVRDSLAQPGLRGLGRFVSASLAADRDLLAPVRAAIRGKTHLVVVPDGPLHAMPFEVLIDRSADSFASLPYLIRSRAVSYAPSMSVAATLAQGGRTPGQAADKALVIFARAIAAPGLPLLAHVEAEGRAIAALFPSGRADLLVGAAATETAMRRPEVMRARGLHFATHGLLRPPPGSSGLALGSATAGEDGFVEADEVAHLQLAAELVVLSGCDTGLGRHMAAEGTLGLTRAFLLAGASGVVSSLWKVDDRSTARLMTAFYGGLGRGTPQALQAAKLQLIKQPDLAHPYYWAAFVLNGR